MRTETELNSVLEFVESRSLRLFGCVELSALSVESRSLLLSFSLELEDVEMADDGDQKASKAKPSLFVADATQIE